ncbi:hypothetical protein GCM10028857_08960 [Salinarchaeum chitinilyticum]
MDVDLHDELDADAYDELVESLATDAAAELPMRNRSDAVWDTVGAVVPQMTDAVCERVLALADSEPRAELVEQVTAERGSDDAETLRAEALTALVADVEARLAEIDDE